MPKWIAIALLVVAAVAAPSIANAQERPFRGIVGLTTGTLHDSEIGRYGDDHRFAPRPPRFHGPPETDVRPRYRGPKGVHERRAAAWSPTWYRWCADRYRTFNPRTGTIMGRDGRPEFCTVR